MARLYREEPDSREPTGLLGWVDPEEESCISERSGHCADCSVSCYLRWENFCFLARTEDAMSGGVWRRKPGFELIRADRSDDASHFALNGLVRHDVSALLSLMRTIRQTGHEMAYRPNLPMPKCSSNKKLPRKPRASIRRFTRSHEGAHSNSRAVDPSEFAPIHWRLVIEIAVDDPVPDDDGQVTQPKCNRAFLNSEMTQDDAATGQPRVWIIRQTKTTPRLS
jgi:hypothetical protein